MTAVVLDIDLSLDEFVAAEGSRPGQPLGDAGERLRDSGYTCRRHVEGCE